MQRIWYPKLLMDQGFLYLLNIPDQGMKPKPKFLESWRLVLDQKHWKWMSMDPFEVKIVSKINKIIEFQTIIGNLSYCLFLAEIMFHGFERFSCKLKLSLKLPEKSHLQVKKFTSYPLVFE